MKRICPITYEWTENPQAHSFHASGLRLLSPHLNELHPLSQDHEALRKLAEQQSPVFSWSGTQAKVLATLAVKQSCFVPDSKRGRYLLKAQDPSIERLPENEAITLHLARIAGIDIAASGLVDAAEPSSGFALWTRCVDRIGQGTRLKLTPFRDLLEHGIEPNTEALIEVLDAHATFPAQERAAFFQTVLFNFMVGNSGMHAGKWHLLTDSNGITRLAPRFGLRNTQLVDPGEYECSLPLGDSGGRVDKSMLLSYLGRELLRLPEPLIQKIADGLLHHAIAWKLALERSYLLPRQKFDYQLLLNERCSRLR